MRKSRIQREAQEEVQNDLDLTPILSLMIVLIPMLLLTAAFVQIKVIEAPLPQFIAEAMAENASGEQLITVDVDLMKDRSVHIRLGVNGKESKRTIAGQPGASHGLVALDQVRAELIKVKRLHPTVFSMSIHPAPDVTYDEIVKVLDVARSTGVNSETFEIINRETGEKNQTELMFPEVTFGNLVEG